MRNRTSTEYATTVTDLNDPDIAMYKHLAKVLNARNKYEELIGNIKPEFNSYFWRYRLVIRGRLGKKNPNAHLYSRGGKHWRPTSMNIRKEHASRFDLYLQTYRRYIKKVDKF